MDALVDHVRSVAKTSSDSQRKEILNQLRTLAHSLETSDDTIQRLTFSWLELAVVYIGIDLKLFSHLIESASPLSVAQLSEKTEASPALLARILRYLASIDAIQETDKDTFAANNITDTLSTIAAEAAIHHYFESMNPAIAELPGLLKDLKYADPEDNTNTGIQRAFKTDLPAFLWLQGDAEKVSYFQTYMATVRFGDKPTFLDKYPVEEKITNLSPDRPLFVDVGGGFGSQAVAFKQKYPNLPGRIIFQDLPQTVEQVATPPGVEGVPYDFFQPQGIKGAKFYYLRNIFHDFPDDKSRLILKNLIDALADDSLILIDDMVLPNKGAHWHTTQIDLLMMATLASRERTEEHWHKLLGSVGLKISNVYTYTDPFRDSIIEVIRA